MEKYLIYQYEIDQGILVARLLSASNLMAADRSGTSDPYVIFVINGVKVYQSEVIKKTLNPVWKNQEFSTVIVSHFTLVTVDEII